MKITQNTYKKHEEILQPSASIKRCSIVFLGQINSSKMAWQLRVLSEGPLLAEYEIIITNDGMLDIAGLRAIMPTLKIVTVPAGLKFEQLCVEAARQAKGEYILFASGPVSKEQITSAVQQLEGTQMQMATSPDKSRIIVKRPPFLEAKGFKKLLYRAEQLMSVEFDFEPENEPQNLNTRSSKDGRFGHILQISDRISMLSLMPGNGVIAEIGVFTGQFSAKILDITKPAQLHLIDAWPNEAIQSGGQRVNGYEAYEFVAHRFKKEIGSGCVILHRKLSAYASQEFENEYFDWIYIDAGHYCEAVKCDLKFWYPKVKRGGFITGHDYVNKPGCGVIQAVNEFVHKWPIIFIALTQDSSPSWVLKKLA